MPQLEITKSFAVEQAADPHWIFHDNAARKELGAIHRSAEANGYLDMQWYERPRVSQRTGGPYTERKICATYRVSGAADRLMVSWVNKSGSVTWKAAFGDDGWKPAKIPPMSEQPQDPSAETASQDQA